MPRKSQSEIRVPLVEQSRWRRLIRRTRAVSESISRWMKPLGPWVRLFILILASGAFVLSIRAFGWEMNLSTVISGVVMVSLVASVLAWLTQKVDDLTRSHVGGLRIEVSEASLRLPEDAEVIQVELESALFEKASEFADRLYLGTMVAGQGTDPMERQERRRDLWARKMSQVPEALQAVVLDNELAAITLVHPIDHDARVMALEGQMDYRRLGKKQMVIGQADRESGFGVYVSVTIGDSKRIRSCEEQGVDLVGAAVARHLALLHRAHQLPLDSCVWITDGFRGAALRAYRRKGFAKTPYKNVYGYPVLKLDPEQRAGVPLVRVVRAAVDGAGAAQLATPAPSDTKA